MNQWRRPRLLGLFSSQVSWSQASWPQEHRKAAEGDAHRTYQESAERFKPDWRSGTPESEVSFIKEGASFSLIQVFKVYVFIHLCTHTYSHIHTYIHIHLHQHVHIHIHIRIHISMYVCMYTLPLMLYPCRWQCDTYSRSMFRHVSAAEHAFGRLWLFTNRRAEIGLELRLC